MTRSVHLAILPLQSLSSHSNRSPNLAVQLIFYKHLPPFRSSQSWCSDSPPAAGRLWCLQVKLHLSTRSQKVERGISKRMSLGFQLLLQASCLAWPSGCWESLVVLVMGSWKQISSLKSFCKLYLTLQHLHSPNAPPNISVRQRRIMVNAFCWD